MQTATRHTRSSAIDVADLVVDYPGLNGEALRAVERVEFAATPGRRIALVGPSGCGKSTILKAMAGLLRPTGGRILFDGLVPQAAREQKLFGLVPQHPALLKWRVASDNVALPLELSGARNAASLRRVDELLELFGLDSFARYYPNQLSGGMQSRVAIARALALEPGALLLDECFGSLDELTRERLYCELSPMWHELGTTLVLVTHSLAEAIYLSDEIVVLTSLPARVAGRVIVGAPQPRSEEFIQSEEFLAAMSRARALLGLSGDPATKNLSEAVP